MADHLGLPRGKYIPSRYADHGVRHCKGTWALGFDRDMTPYTTGSGWEVGLPDMEARFEASDVRPGWEEGTRVVVADLTSDGAPVAVSPRAALRRAIGAWEAEGLRTDAGIELEAYLLEPDGQGGFRPIDTPGAFVYGTGMAVDPHGVIDDIWRARGGRRALLGVGELRVRQRPVRARQLRYADALRAADDVFLFKVLAREVAAKRGFLLTFIGPIAERGGSGLHLNLSWCDESGATS